MKNAKLPAWMRSTRPDTIFKNCLNVHEGLVEACDFDPAMCQACESTPCKWHPSKLGPGRAAEELDEEEDEDEEDDARATDEDGEDGGEAEEPDADER